ARSTGDARAPGAIEDLRPLPFLGRHRQDDRLDVLEPLRVDLDVLQHLVVDAGQQLEEVLERPEILHLAHRGEEVLEVETTGSHHLPLELRRLLLVERGLCLLDQPYYVPLLQDPASQALRVELLEPVQLLAYTEELDGLSRYPINRERGTAPRIPIHLRQDDAGDVQRIVESLGDPHRLLTGHTVGDEENLGRLEGGPEPPQLIHQLLVDLQATRRVDDQYPVALSP